MPFVGKITQRPSVLDGAIEQMVTEGKEYLKKGVYGIDLLGYRYVGDAVQVNRNITSEINAPVCIAGSVNSYQRLREIAETNARFFTIGSVFFDHIFGNDSTEAIDSLFQRIHQTGLKTVMLSNNSEDRNKLFCDINPTCYKISLQKEIAKRHVQNMLSKEKFAGKINNEKLPNLVSEHHSHLIKRGKGIDPILQENKAVNIALANKTINGIMIYPGETFSFWKQVGKTTKRKGYRDGRVIIKNKLIPGTGGGLCNLGNTIHRLILHSPLTVTEFHSHSDALAPDEGKRVPFSSGTSVFYNNGDYRFKNNTKQAFQLLIWCENEQLCAELRSERPIEYAYRLVEEGHHFQKEGEKYYRVSKIYKETLDKETQKPIHRELVLDNHSEVMYDYELIPKEIL